MNQAVASVLESIRNEDLEEARTKLAAMMAQAMTARE